MNTTIAPMLVAPLRLRLLTVGSGKRNQHVRLAGALPMTQKVARDLLTYAIDCLMPEDTRWEAQSPNAAPQEVWVRWQLDRIGRDELIAGLSRMRAIFTFEVLQ